MEGGRLLLDTMEKLKSEVIRQQVCVPRADTEVPALVVADRLKGLSVKPEDRYTTIDSLLEDLEKDPEEVRRQKRLARRRKMLLISLIAIDCRITNRCLVRTSVQNISAM